jgi:alpha-tubulin suppressor-like RCC1 family protein
MMNTAARTPLRRSVVGLTTLTITASFVGVLAAAMPAAASPATVGFPAGWGLNNTGQLGNGTTTSTTTANPTPGFAQLPASANIVSISAGSAHTLALDANGTVYAWGDNTEGELGNGTTTSSTTPVTVSVPAGVTFTAVSAGFGNSMALGSDGKVYTWGFNNVGQLGNGTTVATASLPTPASLPTGSIATAISAGYAHDLALTSDGKVYAWGDNAQGEIGDNTVTTRRSPVQIPLLGAVTATGIAAGYYDSFAMTTGGKANAWGLNSSGELGNGGALAVTTQHKPVAVALPAGVSITTIAAGGAHTLALSTTGSVVSWGANNKGQLGTGSAAAAALPTEFHLPGGVSATAVAAGVLDSYALGADGLVYSWGDNSVGSLGTGDTTAATSNVPVTAVLPAGTHAVGISSSQFSGDAFALLAGLPTTTSVVSNHNPSTAGDPVTFTATVSGGDDGGTVAFTADGSTITGCDAEPVGADGTAPCTTSDLAAGTHGITATYSGDGVYAGSSAALDGGQVVKPLVVGPAATKLSATPVSIVKSLLALKVTYSATLTKAADGSPVANQTVAFAPNTTLLTSLGTCSGTTNAHGVATCSATVLGVVPGLLGGKYTATFAGNDQWGPSTATSTISLP